MKTLGITIHRSAGIVFATAVAMHLFAGPLARAVADTAFVQFVQETPLPPREPAPQLRRSPTGPIDPGPIDPGPIDPGPIRNYRRRFDPTGAAARSVVRNTAGTRRLARTPEMFGDFFGPTILVELEENILALQSAGPGGGIVKISDNNKAAISQRCYVMYNHFHNSRDELELSFGVPVVKRTHIDRITFGFEHPLGDSPWSAEFRAPFNAHLDDRLYDFKFEAGEFGNLAVILKRELRRTDEGVVSMGLGTSLPSGGDILAATDFQSVLVQNDAYHILPFAAVQRVSGDWFLHGFLQLDFSANGNTVIGDRATTLKGVVNDQALLFADLGIGRWLYRNENAHVVRDVAAMLECHYETALQDADIVDLPVGGGPNIVVGNSINRFESVNVTAMIQATLGRRTVIRVGGVAPLTARGDRFFDAEVSAQLIFR